MEKQEVGLWDREARKSMSAHFIVGAREQGKEGMRCSDAVRKCSVKERAMSLLLIAGD